MKKMKRGFSLLLSAVLVLGMVPAQGFAAECQHVLTYSAEGACITATCGNEGCTYKATATLELDKEASLAYTGEEVKPLKVVYSEGWLGEKNDVITYVNNVEVTKLQEAAAEPVKEETPEEETQPAPEETVPESETEPLDPREEKPPVQKPEEPKIPTGTLTIGGVSVSMTFTIMEKEKLTVTATATVSYGDDAPSYELVYKNADGKTVVPVLSGEPQVTSTYSKEAKAGDRFDIEVNVDGVTSDQYELEAENGEGEVAPRKLTVKLDNTEYIYDGQGHTPKVVVEGLVFGDQVDADYESVPVTDVGEYKVPVSGFQGDEAVLKNYEKLPEGTELSFAVKPRTVEIDWGTLEFEYDGEKQLPTPKITNRVGEDDVELDLDKKEGEIKAGTYKITVVNLLGTHAGNYTHSGANVTAEYTISLPAQEAPTGVTAEPETIRGKADGKITGVDVAMEYAAKPAEGEAAYKKISGETIEDLAAGTYLVRYAETDEKAASAPVEVTVAAGAPLTVTLPVPQTGFILTADKTEAGWEESVTLTFTMANGYVQTEDFAVKVNDETVKLDKNGKYTISKLQENANVTVEGVEPILTMSLMGTEYHAVEEEITFQLYSKTTKTLTITTGLDDGTIFYVETEAKTDPAGIADDKWTEYEGPVTIAKKDRKAVFYAKVVDKDKNVYYASTNGVVFDTKYPVVKVNGKTVTFSTNAFEMERYTTQIVTVTDENLSQITLNSTNLSLTDEIPLAGDINKRYILRISDAAGNAVQLTVQMNLIEDLKKSEEDLKRIDEIIEKECDNATTNQQNKLKDIQKDKNAYLVILQIQALPDAEDVKPYNEDHRDAYDAVQDAYDKLTTDQKKLVTDTDKKHLEDVKEAMAYQIIGDEDDLQWEKKSKVDLVIKVNGPDARFKELQISSKTVATTKYTHKEDTYGTKITIDEAYLETLTTGKKTIKVVYTDGSTDGTDQIEILKAGSTNPKTGDEGIRFWMTASVLSLVCLAAAVVPGRKRKFQA